MAGLIIFLLSQGIICIDIFLLLKVLLTMKSMWMTTKEAGAELSISADGVRKLIDSGTLAVSTRVGRNILIDRTAVLRLKNRGTRVGRPWSAASAWAALALISGKDTGWIDSQTRYRLRRRLLGITALDLAALASRKDASTRYRVMPSEIDGLRRRLLLTGSAAMAEAAVASQFGLVAGLNGNCEGYVLASEADHLVQDYFMVPDPEGNVTLRVIDSNVSVTQDELATVVVAVDLMDSLASRERKAGESVLESILKKWQDHGNA